MKKFLRTLSILVLLSLGFLFLIKNPQLPISQTIFKTIGLEKLLTGQTATITNPASVFCLQNSGTSTIVTDASGAQSGLCRLLDGTSCEERAYMRGECPATGTQLTGTDLTDAAGGLMNVSLFSDSEIGISFSYPTSWGTITKDSDTNTSKYLIMLLKDKQVFFAFHNGDTPSARGAFWGDAAQSISSNDYITKFCTKESKCALYTNTNGIQYAKYTYEQGEMGSNQTYTRIGYMIFNPNSPYRGIIMSNERIPNTSTSDLDAIINSLSFL